MPRNATGIVTTIGIDIGKNNLHLIGLDDCLGSQIGIGGRLAAPPLPHHRAYGSRTTAVRSD